MVRTARLVVIINLKIQTGIITIKTPLSRVDIYQRATNSPLPLAKPPTEVIPVGAVMTHDLEKSAG